MCCCACLWRCRAWLRRSVLGVQCANDPLLAFKGTLLFATPTQAPTWGGSAGTGLVPLCRCRQVQHQFGLVQPRPCSEHGVMCRMFWRATVGEEHAAQQVNTRDT
jgi:hypothetical protein